jgi:HD-like signal output (HDOD) protein
MLRKPPFSRRSFRTSQVLYPEALEQREAAGIYRQIFETEDILKSNDLLLLINSVEKLPRSKQLSENPGDDRKNASTGQIAAEIEKDFAISSRLLQIANSAFYGYEPAPSSMPRSFSDSRT